MSYTAVSFILVVIILIVSSYVHLGHVINSDLSDKDNIMRKRCTFVGQINNVQCYFPTLAADVRYKLFRSYCSSIYGCELWHLNDSNINNFCTAWRTGLRRVGTFLTPLTVICCISLVMIYQFMTSCVVVLFCFFKCFFSHIIVLCSSLQIMTSYKHGISHWLVVTFIFVYPVLIFVLHCF